MSEPQRRQSTGESFHLRSSRRGSGQLISAPGTGTTTNPTTREGTDAGSAISRTTSVVSLRLTLFPYGPPNHTAIPTMGSPSTASPPKCSPMAKSLSRPTLLSLPSSVLQQIAGHLPGYSSLKSLILARKSLASLFLPLLYQRGLIEYTPSKLLYFAVVMKQNQMLHELLYTYSVDPNSPLHGRTPLVVAVQKQELSAVRLLCRAKADVNFIPVHEEGSSTPERMRELQCTALEEACAEKAPLDERTLSIVKVLLNHGANLSIRNREGKTPLHQAISSGNSRLVRILLTHGADPNERVSKHAYGRIYGAPSSQNPTQRMEYTPLHLAVSIPNQTNETREIIQLLVSTGANLEAILCSPPSPPPTLPRFDSLDCITTPPPANTLHNIASEPIYLASTPLVMISLKLLQFWISRQTTAAVRPIPPKQYLLRAREENKRTSRLSKPKNKPVSNSNSSTTAHISLSEYKGYILTIEMLLSLGAELEPALKAVWPNIVAFPDIISGPLSTRDWHKWIILCSTQTKFDLEKASVGARSLVGVKQVKKGWWYLKNYDYGEVKERILGGKKTQEVYIDDGIEEDERENEYPFRSRNYRPENFSVQTEAELQKRLS